MRFLIGKTVLTLFLGLLTTQSWASQFDCRVIENLSDEKKMILTATEPGKHLVRSEEDYTFYLNTFTDQTVELEVFLPSADMRIYSKGNIEKNSVTLTSWQRDALLDFTCKKIEWLKKRHSLQMAF